MARQIVDINGLTEILPLTRHQIYKAIRRSDYPLPYKKLGKKLMFDVDRIFTWFDGLPGKDRTFNEVETDR